MNQTFKRFRRPSFLVGVIFGIGVSTVCFEILLTIQTDISNVLYVNLETGIQSYLKENQDDGTSKGRLKRDSSQQNTVTDAFDKFQVSYDPKLVELGELQGRKLVHAAVLADANTLRSYATAIQQTWENKIPATFLYGTLAGNYDSKDQMKGSVPLKGAVIGETYSFEHALISLKYVCDHVLDDYHWFVLLKDATYINADSLLSLLHKISASEPILIGRPVPESKRHCSMEAGLIFSREALVRFCPHISTCHKQPDIATPSVNLGNCISKHTNTMCVHSSAVTPKFHVYDPLKPRKAVDDFKYLSNKTAFVGPLQDIDSFYKLYLYFLSNEIAVTQQEISFLGRELAKTQSHGQTQVRGGHHTSSGIAIGLKGNQSDSILREFVDPLGYVFQDTCFLTKKYLFNQDEAFPQARKLAKARLGPKVDEMDYFAFRSIKPGIGVEYNFYFQDFRAKRKRRDGGMDQVHQVTVLQPYGKLYIDSKETIPLTRVNMVVIAPETFSEFSTFMEGFEAMCLEGSPKVTCTLLVLVFLDFHTDDNLRLLFRDTINRHAEQYPTQEIRFMEISGETDSLARTIQITESAFTKSSLLAFLHTDVSFNLEFLLRCQMNTKLAQKVYFPVPFQTYDSDVVRSKLNDYNSKTLDISENAGFWNIKNYDTFCAYSGDLQSFDNLPYSGKDLYEMFLGSGGVKIFRALEPGLHRAWEKNLCDLPTLQEKTQCMEENKLLHIEM